MAADAGQSRFEYRESGGRSERRARPVAMDRPERRRRSSLSNTQKSNKFSSDSPTPQCGDRCLVVLRKLSLITLSDSRYISHNLAIPIEKPAAGNYFFTGQIGCCGQSQIAP